MSQTLKLKVQSFYDVQNMRISASNRQLKINSTINLELKDIDFFKKLSENLEQMEKQCGKEVEKSVAVHPLWLNWLCKVRGCGTQMAAVLISNIDIHRATTVSKIWSVCGIGKERKYLVRYRERKEGAKEWGKEIEKEVFATSPESAQHVIPRGKIFEKRVEREFGEIVPIGDFERQQLRPGQYPTYNQFLKTKVVGVLADCFIKGRNTYTTFYYNYKARFENDIGKEKRFKKPMHLHLAARRYMMKMFLIDLYKNWRKIEGLEVRPSYQEQYLGHTHKE